MTARDCKHGQLAMQGWAADGGLDIEAGARWAFKLADAMLAEGNK
jgi:hypothetical protein